MEFCNEFFNLFGDMYSNGFSLDLIIIDKLSHITMTHEVNDSIKFYLSECTDSYYLKIDFF